MSERMRRVNEALREVLSEAVGDLKDPRIGFVTVTGVETSPDLRHARVYVSVLGNERKRERALAGLQAAHAVLQARDALGSLLAMKLALDQLGKDSFMYLTGPAPLPQEYAFMPLDGLSRAVPPD